ncbi:hypothetical protein HMPREF7215_1911 [Pyramidobacter piscolens W5455]|uniref:Uncharacterized protein n=1 Tax=Pyramidobacter piscolens W5455 TaxID=352165 RepID=A0ABM9ZYS6_9BACT|nr:hypothetical protein HMPREF7215_1911 [Pyramidobacter piscolens W5455]
MIKMSSSAVRGDFIREKRSFRAMKRICDSHFCFGFYYGVHCVGISLRSDV